MVRCKAYGGYTQYFWISMYDVTYKCLSFKKKTKRREAPRWLR